MKRGLVRLATVIDRWQWLLLAAAAPFLLFPGVDLRLLALFVVPALWLAAWVARGEPVSPTPLNLTLALFALMVLVSALVTFDLAFSLGKLAGVVLGLGVFFAFVRYGRSTAGWWQSVGAFIIVGIGIAGLGLLMTSWLEKVSILAPITSRLGPRLLGVPGAEGGLHPNEVAGALAWVLPLLVTLSVASLIRVRSVAVALGRQRTILLVTGLCGITAFVGFTLLLTQSRSAFIGLAFSGLLGLFIVLPGRWRGLYLTGLLIAGLGAIWLWQTNAAGALAQATNQANGDYERALSLDSLEGRLEVWSRALYAIQDFPFTGMGMNTWRRVVHVLYPLFLAGPDTDIAHAHNELLQAALDLGVPGFIAFLGLYLGAFWMLLTIWTQARSVRPGQASAGAPDKLLGAILTTRALALGLGLSLAAHFVYGLTDAVTLGAKPGVLFWMLLGLVVGLYQQSNVGRVEQMEPNMRQPDGVPGDRV